ncbi:hypothetical protein NL676_038198 [Syzygium grande]|nr:hypothetical protein NL676_038198 [Syzygium grande]
MGRGGCASRGGDARCGPLASQPASQPSFRVYPGQCSARVRVGSGMARPCGLWPGIALVVVVGAVLVWATAAAPRAIRAWKLLTFVGRPPSSHELPLFLFVGVGWSRARSVRAGLRVPHAQRSDRQTSD